MHRKYFAVQFHHLHVFNSIVAILLRFVDPHIGKGAQLWFWCRWKVHTMFPLTVNRNNLNISNSFNTDRQNKTKCYFRRIRSKPRGINRSTLNEISVNYISPQRGGIDVTNELRTNNVQQTAWPQRLSFRMCHLRNVIHFIYIYIYIYIYILARYLYTPTLFLFHR